MKAIVGECKIKERYKKKAMCVASRFLVSFRLFLWMTKYNILFSGSLTGKMVLLVGKSRDRMTSAR